MVATYVKNISKISENPTILLIYGEPTYATIHSLHKLLNSNAASILTNLRCGTLSLLCLNPPIAV